MRLEKYESCIEACLECAVECEYCASEFLLEPEVKDLTKCIQLARECAEMCMGTARIMALGSEYAGENCRICADYCNRCATECEKYLDMRSCRKCAEICRDCEDECNEVSIEHLHK